ncbi:MAG: outer membrane protein assembly factor BamA [Epsilonproteobacteria bacterium]|nr:outer membrane protein assembly factor BamA [Campylobacterota bacterium]
MLKRVAFVSVIAATFLYGAAQPNKIVTLSTKGIDEAKVEAITGIKEGEEYSPAKVQAAARKLEEALKQAGYVDAKVSVAAKKKNNGVKVIFNVDKGEPIKVRKVTFIGNKKLSDKILKENLVNKEGGFFSWLTGGGEAVPSQLEYDLARVRDEYLKRGYLDVEIDKPLMKTDFASKSAEVTYTIRHEGPQYKVSTLRVEPIPGFNMKELQKEFELKPGQVFDVSKLRHDLKLLVEKAADKGYAFANAQPRFRKNDDTRTIDVIYSVDLGEKIKVNDVKISGNTKTKDHVIRRYIYLAPGDTFSLTDLKDSQAELQRTGFFDSVSIIPKKIGDNKVDLDVNVDEAQTGSITAGISYGSYDGFGINASLSDKNFLGTGIGYSLNLMRSNKSYNYGFSIIDPRVFDSLYSLSLGAYLQKYEFIDYTKKEKGAYVSLGRKLTRHLHASIGYNYASVDYSDYETADEDYNFDYESYKKSSLISAITFDNTDDYFTPRKGYYAKLNLEYAGLGGDAEFFKTKLKAAAYKGLRKQLDYDLILRTKLRLGYIADKGFVPRAERLYLGGSSYGVRGFSTASISPMSEGYGEGVRIGGTKSGVVSLEASVPLSLVRNMRLTGFVDYGIIEGYGQTEKRSSVGAQIEWRSPFGPINLIFAKPLNDKDYDRTSTFEFTIGSKF